jgi:hypothetical protein
MGTAADTSSLSCAGCGGPLTGQQRKWCSPECQRDAARAARLQLTFNITVEEYDPDPGIPGREMRHLRSCP